MIIAIGNYIDQDGFGSSEGPNDPWVFIEAGQSNSDGSQSKLAQVSSNKFANSVPTYLQSPLNNVYIWDNEAGQFTQLVPGTNSSIAAPGVGNDIVGADCEYGYRLAQYFNRPIYIVKYAVNSSKLCADAGAITWSTTEVGEYYDTLKSRITAAKNWLQTNVGTARFKGFHWNQGEADAEGSPYASELTALISGVRTHVNTPSMFVECVVPFNARGSVQSDIQTVCNADSNAEFYDARYRQTTDGTHYGLFDMCAIGFQFYADLKTALGYESLSVTYASDFSAGANSVLGLQGTVAGNIDGIVGVNDTLRFFADGSGATHLMQRNSTITSGQKYRVKFKYYMPTANTHVNGLSFRATTEFMKWTVCQTNRWTEIPLTEFTANSAAIQIFTWDDLSSSYTGANVVTDDLIYIKDIRIELVTTL